MSTSPGTVGRNVLWGLKHPSLLRRSLKERNRYLSQLLRKGNIGGALYLLPFYVSSDTRYFSKYLARSTSDGAVRANCGDFDLFVRPDDVGIGHELYITGTHEPRTTRAYRDQIRKLRNTATDLTVVEIGGNIGYYTLTTLADAPEAQIYSIEPVPANVELLERNLRLNGYSDNVDITEGAISTTDGSTELTLVKESNKGLIPDHESPTGVTIPIDTWTIETFVDEAGIDPEDITVLRMDLEGHESNLFFDGFADFLDQTGHPFLLNIELHPFAMDDDACRSILDFLDNRFRLVAGYSHNSRGILLASVSDMREIIEQDLDWVELVLRKDEI